MILAAGEGTRLRPLTLATPKPMIPIVGRPLLAWTLHWLAGEGVTEAAINLYHKPQSIPDYFGSDYCGVRLHYFYEETLRGTAGGVKGAESALRGGPFFVIYGDNLLHADLRTLWDYHRAHGGAATLALFAHPNPSAAGIVGRDSAGRITRFVEKPPPGEVFSHEANAGVYVLDDALLEHIGGDVASDFGRDIFPALLAQGVPLYGTALGGYIQDTGTPDSYRQANWDALGGKVGAHYADNGVYTGNGAQVHPTALLRGRSILGAGTQVGAHAVLTDCILWDNAVVEAGARLERVILGNRARVRAGAQVPKDALLGDNETAA